MVYAFSLMFFFPFLYLHGLQIWSLDGVLWNSCVLFIFSCCFISVDVSMFLFLHLIIQPWHSVSIWSSLQVSFPLSLFFDLLSFLHLKFQFNCFQLSYLFIPFQVYSLHWLSYSIQLFVFSFSLFCLIICIFFVFIKYSYAFSFNFFVWDFI